MARLKEAEEVAASSVFFRTGTQQAAPVAQSQVAAAPGFAANAAFDPMAGGPASTAAQPADPTAVQNRQDQKEAFQQAGTTETRNSGNLQMPASPYQVMAGTVVAGALVTGIKSDLPGDVIATVTEPVYDTATGRFLLIPQGSRILGRYNSQVSDGQSRVQVVWHRIIRRHVFAQARQPGWHRPGVPRRTVYSKPVKSAPKVDPRFAGPIKVMIEESPSFVYWTVADLLGFNRNTVQSVADAFRAVLRIATSR